MEFQSLTSSVDSLISQVMERPGFPSRYAYDLSVFMFLVLVFLNLCEMFTFQYGTSRGVIGTPTFLVNGFATQADDSWTLADWIALLNPLLLSVEVKEL